MRIICSLVFVSALFLGTQCAFGNHIEQPNFPKPPNPETEMVRKIVNFDCADLYIFQYSAGKEKYWKFYYLGDNFSQHKPIVVMYVDEAKNLVRAWVDNNRDGHFDEQFDDGLKVFKKYPTPCKIVGTET